MSSCTVGLIMVLLGAETVGEVGAGTEPSVGSPAARGGCPRGRAGARSWGQAPAAGATGSGAPAGLGAADAVGGDPFLVSGVAADLGGEGIHEDVVGGDDIAGSLCRCQGLGVEQKGPRGHLLDIEHRSDLAFDLVLHVVALVEHERDIGAVEAASANHLVNDAK